MIVLWSAIFSLVLFAGALVGGLVLQGIDRKAAAVMQARIGPRIIQPWWDIQKLLVKQTIVPDGATTWLFHGAPVVALASALTVLLYVPIAGLGPVLDGHGDTLLIMYLLAMPAVGLVLGGFASASPYAAIGAQREMVTMIGYELPLAGVVIGFGHRYLQAGFDAPFALSTMTDTPIWQLVGPVGVVGTALMLIAFAMVIPGELGKAPFDSAEAKSELADGLLVEYSGRNLAMYYLGLGVKMVVLASLLVALFMPWTMASVGILPGSVAPIVDVPIFLIKVLVVVLGSMTMVRLSMARLRITQVMELYWKYAGSLALVGLLLLLVDGWIA